MTMFNNTLIYTNSYLILSLCVLKVCPFTCIINACEV